MIGKFEDENAIVVLRNRFWTEYFLWFDGFFCGFGVVRGAKSH